MVELAIKELLDELGSISQFIKPGDKVLIKPNLKRNLHLEGVQIPFYM